MTKLNLKSLILCMCLAASGAHAQNTTLSASAQSMARQGLVNVQDVDPSIKVSLMYSRPDNFCHHVLYEDLREAYLHPDAANALKKAQTWLKKHYPTLSLKIYDAARPMSIQEHMWEIVKDTPSAPYVSDPTKGGGMHNYGVAVDLTLCNERGDTIHMGTKVDHFGPEAHVVGEKQLVKTGAISREALKNRRILRKAMLKAGFKTLYNEWWHFNLVPLDEAKKLYKVVR